MYAWILKKHRVRVTRDTRVRVVIYLISFKLYIAYVCVLLNVPSTPQYSAHINLTRSQWWWHLCVHSASRPLGGRGDFT